MLAVRGKKRKCVRVRVGEARGSPLGPREEKEPEFLPSPPPRTVGLGVSHTISASWFPSEMRLTATVKASVVCLLSAGPAWGHGMRAHGLGLLPWGTQGSVGKKDSPHLGSS